MVLGEQLKRFLNQFLDKFVEPNYDLSIQLWSSDSIRLKDVRLKQAIFPSSLPLQLKVGYIGEITAYIPFSTLGNSPARISVSDALLVVSPKSDADRKVAEAEASFEEGRRQTLDDDAAIRINGIVFDPTETDGYFGVDGYFGRLLSKLIDNLQLTIKNLHVRFEGDYEAKWLPKAVGKFAIGVSVEEIHAETTDSNWSKPETPLPTKTDQNLIFKKFTFQHLSLYVDPTAFHLIHSSVHQRVIDASLSRLQTMGGEATRFKWWQESENPLCHRFALAPFTGVIKMVFNTATRLSDNSRPRYDAMCIISKTIATIDEQQVSLLLKLATVFEEHGKWQDGITKECEQLLNRNWESKGLDQQSEFSVLYTEAWGTLLSLSRTRDLKTVDFEKVIKLPAYARVVELEKNVPVSVILALRNRSTSNYVPEEAFLASDSISQLGGVLGIQSPEVKIAYAEGSVGLELFIPDGQQDVVVKKCVKGGQSDKLGLVKPGYIIQKVNGESVKGMAVKEVNELLDTPGSSRVITFQIPGVQHSYADPNLLISSIKVEYDALEVWMINGSYRCSFTALQARKLSLRMDAHGSGLFSFGSFNLSVGNLWLKETTYDPDACSCLLSSCTVPNMPVIDALRAQLILPSDSMTPLKASVELGRYRLVLDGYPWSKVLRQIMYFLSSYHTPERRSSVDSQDVHETRASSHDSPDSSTPTRLDLSLSVASLGLCIVEPQPIERKKQDDIKQSLGFRIASVLGAVDMGNSGRSSLGFTQGRGAAPELPEHAILWVQSKFRRMKERTKYLDRNKRMDGAVIHGWLFFEDHTMYFRRWKRYYCVFYSDKTLSFYSDGICLEERATYDLSSVEEITWMTDYRAPKLALDAENSCFALCIKDTALIFSGASVKESTDWIEQFSKECGIAATVTLSSIEMTTLSSDSLALAVAEPKHFSATYAQWPDYTDTFVDRFQPTQGRNENAKRWSYVTLEGFKHRFSGTLAPFFNASVLAAELTVVSLYVWKESTPTIPQLHLGAYALGFHGGEFVTIISDSVSESTGGKGLRAKLLYCGTLAEMDIRNGQKSGLDLNVMLSGFLNTYGILEVVTSIQREITKITAALESSPDTNPLQDDSVKNLAPTPEVAKGKELVTELIEDVSEAVLDILQRQGPDMSYSIKDGQTGTQESSNSNTTQIPAPGFEVDQITIAITAHNVEIFGIACGDRAKISAPLKLAYKADPMEEKMQLDVGPMACFVLTENVARTMMYIKSIRLLCGLRRDHSVPALRLKRVGVLKISTIDFEADGKLNLLVALVNSLVGEELAFTEQPVDRPKGPREETVQTVLRSARNRPGITSSIIEKTYVPESPPTPHRSLTDIYENSPLFGDRSYHSTRSNRWSKTETEKSFTAGGTSAIPRLPTFFDPSVMIKVGNRSQGSLNSTASPQTEPHSPTSTPEPPVVFGSILRLLGFIGIADHDRTGMSLYQDKYLAGQIVDEWQVEVDMITLQLLKRSLQRFALDTFLPVGTASLYSATLQAKSASMFQDDYSFHFKAALKAQYYNTMLAEWEPLIEPWRVIILMEKGITDGTLVINFKSQERLNINITAAFLELYYSFQRSKRHSYLPKSFGAWKLREGSRLNPSDFNLGRVAALNDLGVPIHLANLGTSLPGVIRVEIRDAWTLPNLHRFHDCSLNLSLLPWRHPNKTRPFQGQAVTIDLPYEGAQPGVAPKLQVRCSVNRTEAFGLFSQAKLEEGSVADGDYVLVGHTEIDLVSRLTSASKPLKQWMRLHNNAGEETSEVLLVIHFMARENTIRDVERTPAVMPGNYLMFDPFALGENEKESAKSELESAFSGKTSVPPIALEVDVLSVPNTLLCPLHRAGRFVIKGNGDFVVEAKVALRDQYRRVVKLVSPVRLKNCTKLELTIWTASPEGSLSLSKSTDSSVVKPGRKYSLPLSSLHSDPKHILLIQCLSADSTILLNDISPGQFILYLPPSSPKLPGCGFFISVVEQVRHVYQEQESVARRGEFHRDLKASLTSISVYPSMSFENALPVRLEFRLQSPSGLDLKTGVLGPGDEEDFYEFGADSEFSLRLPGYDTKWTTPVNFTYFISKSGPQLCRQRTTTKDDTRPKDQRVDFYSAADDLELFKTVNESSHLFSAQFDFTISDHGGPRVVLYTNMWVYNHSHLPQLLFRSAEIPDAKIAIAPQISRARPVPTLMFCDSHQFQVSANVNDHLSQWSQAIPASAVGVQGSISLVSRDSSTQKVRSDVGIAVYRPSGKFHRSAQVVITPRYVFVNYLPVSFEIRGVSKLHQASFLEGTTPVTIGPASETAVAVLPFDFSGGGQTFVQLRCVEQNSRWSGHFSVTEEGEFPLRLRGGEIVGLPHRIRVTIHGVGASIVVTLGRDDPPMYTVRNLTSIDVHVRQIKVSQATDIVQSGECVPFSWDAPASSREMVLRLKSVSHSSHGSARGKHKVTFSEVYQFSFDELQQGSSYMTLEGEQGQTQVSAEVVVEGMTRVLILSESMEDKKSKYIIQLNVLSCKMLSSIPEGSEGFLEVFCADQRVSTPPSRCGYHGIYRFDTQLSMTFATRPSELVIRLREAKPETSRLSFLHTAVPRYLGGYSGRPATTTATPLPDSGAASYAGELTGSSRLRTIYANANSASLGSPTVPDLTKSEPPPANLWANDLEGAEGDWPREQMSQEMTLGNSSIYIPDPDRNQDDLEGLAQAHISLPKRCWDAGLSVAGAVSDVKTANWDLVAYDNEQQKLVPKAEITLSFHFRLGHERSSEGKEEDLWIRAHISSIGISIVNNYKLVEVAYFAVQRIHLLFSQKNPHNEAALIIGNVQLDNQVDEKVVLAPKIYELKSGTDVRLRERVKTFLNYKNRKIINANDRRPLNACQMRVLWSTTEGLTHVELFDVLFQDIVLQTDEKFIVDLITVFQGIGALTIEPDLNEVLNPRVDFVFDKKKQESIMYLELMNIEPIRINVSLAILGGRHVKTLGPAGRRMAAYLPNSSIKELRMNFPSILLVHAYQPTEVVYERLYRHYMQQAAIIILRGLYTVTLFVNPLRIIYRLGHGILEVFRMPARGLASGSPVELLTGTYLGMRSLVTNLISASYETIAGMSGIFAAIVGRILPDRQRKALQEETLGLQGYILDEVSNLDAIGERTATRHLLRQPRVFDTKGIGLLVEYGPGPLPQEQQKFVDLRCAVMIQRWYRRRRILQTLVRSGSSGPETIKAHSSCLIS